MASHVYKPGEYFRHLITNTGFNGTKQYDQKVDNLSTSSQHVLTTDQDKHEITEQIGFLSKKGKVSKHKPKEKITRGPGSTVM